MVGPVAQSDPTSLDPDKVEHRRSAREVLVGDAFTLSGNVTQGSHPKRSQLDCVLGEGSRVQIPAGPPPFGFKTSTVLNSSGASRYPSLPIMGTLNEIVPL